MKNRKYKLLPYETIVKATAGEPEAVNEVIQNYIGYIKYLSYFQGHIIDDIQEYPCWKPCPSFALTDDK